MNTILTDYIYFVQMHQKEVKYLEVWAMLLGKQKPSHHQKSANHEKHPKKLQYRQLLAKDEHLNIQEPSLML